MTGIRRSRQPWRVTNIPYESSDDRDKHGAHDDPIMMFMIMMMTVIMATTTFMSKVAVVTKILMMAIVLTLWRTMMTKKDMVIRRII